MLLIIDEIQAGFGRTGRVWAFQGLGVEPDIFTAGKPIAGGLPIGIAVVKSKFGDVFERGSMEARSRESPPRHGGGGRGVDVLMGGEDVPPQGRELGGRAIKSLQELRARAVLRVRGWIDDWNRAENQGGEVLG